MGTEKHRNWLLMFAETKAPAVLWIAGVFALLVAVTTFFFQPIYGARTVLLLDSDLTKVLRDIEVAYPSANQGDYIRYEYFATNAVALMQVPSLGEQLVAQLDVRDRDGERMFSGNFVEPSRLQLVYDNNGQGVKAQWITDTQQFSITGYSPDPERAVAFSREYTNLFLKENSNQFHTMLNSLLGRLDSQFQIATAKLAELDRQMVEIKNKHHVSTVDDETSTLPATILATQESLDKTRLTESYYKTKLDRLLEEAKNAGELRKSESVMVKNPMIDALKTKIVTLTGSLLAVSADYTPEHPEYKAVELELNYAKETLREEVAKTFSQEKESVSDLYADVMGDAISLTMTHLEYSATAAYYEKLLSTLNARMEELNAVQVKLDAIADEQTALRTVVSTIRQNRLAIGGVLGAPLPFFRVVSPAAIDSANLKLYKYFPKRKRLFVLAFSGMAFLMFSFVLGRDLYANKLYRGWQVAHLGKELEYADIPDRLRGAPSAAAVSHSVQDVLLAVSQAPIIRVRGGDAGAGRVTVGRAVARHFLQRGHSVLLVDGDVQQPCALCAAVPEGGPGLADYLMQPVAVKDLLTVDSVSGVALLPAGRRASFDIDSAAIVPLRTLIPRLQEQFDRIVWLDAPLRRDRLQLADALPPHDLIAVFRSGRHMIFEVDRLRRRGELSRGQFELKGVIVNKVRALDDLFSLRGLWDFCVYPARMLACLFRR